MTNESWMCVQSMESGDFDVIPASDYNERTMILVGMGTKGAMGNMAASESVKSRDALLRKRGIIE
jgi:hypothetical protein